MNIEIFKIKNEYYNKIKNYSYKRIINIISYISYYYKINSIKSRIFLITYNFKNHNIIFQNTNYKYLIIFLSFSIIKLLNKSFINYIFYFFNNK